MLENILHKYFDLPEDWNCNYEKEKEIWHKSYDRLIALLYSLESLGVLKADRICDSLDMISNMEDVDDEL